MSTTEQGRTSVSTEAAPAAAGTYDSDGRRQAAQDRTRTDGVRDAIHVGACVLGGVLVTVGFGLDNLSGDDEGDALIAAVAQAPDRFYVGNLLAAIGLSLMAAVGLAVLRLVRGRARVLATIGGVLMMIGGVAAATGIFLYGSVVSVLADSGLDSSEMGAVEEALGDSARTGITFMVGFPGTFLGLLLVSVALLVSRATPRWVPVSLLAGVVGVLALGSTDWSSVADLLLTVGCLGIALSLWKATRPGTS